MLRRPAIFQPLVLFAVALFAQIAPAAAAVVGLNGDRLIARAEVVGEYIHDDSFGFVGSRTVRGQGVWEWVVTKYGYDDEIIPYYFWGTDCRTDCVVNGPDWIAQYFAIVDVGRDWFYTGPWWDLSGPIYLFENGGDPLKGEYTGLAHGSGSYAFVTVQEVPLPGGVVLLATGVAGLVWQRRRKGSRG